MNTEEVQASESVQNTNKEFDRLVVKFAGDSGDGMQLIGNQFTETSALFGNDLATFPDFPAEIRAPKGTLAGVSGYQVHIGKEKIYSPGDLANVLIAMNPAALITQLDKIEKGGVVIVDEDSFRKPDFKKAKLESDPLEDGTLDAFLLVKAPITSMTKKTLEGSGLDNKSIVRSKNMFALGIVYWMFNKSMDSTIQFFKNKFKNKPQLVESNEKVLKAGYHFGDITELIKVRYVVPKANFFKGKYRNITGNQATAFGLLAAAKKADKELFLGTYPITPASDLLHELTKHKSFGVKIMQAEDEIAGICAAIGASFAGNLAITSTSGPGMALKSEAMGLAVMAEMPLVIIDVQRGGPSTGLPTKTEQADLMQALYGRNGECPMVVIAGSTPSNCFDFAFEAARIAIEHMVPVVLLSDNYIGVGSEPWKIIDTKTLPEITTQTPTASTEEWQPYLRNPDKLSRDWVKPGTKGYEFRLGGLEKEDVTGKVSYDPKNHEKMIGIRAEKVQRVADFIPEQKVYGTDQDDLLVIGWGGTFGPILGAVEKLQEEGKNLAYTHFNYISPFPKNTKEILGKYKRIVVCELNKGQLLAYLRSTFPEFEFTSFNKVQGMPFNIPELKQHFLQLLEN